MLICALAIVAVLLAAPTFAQDDPLRAGALLWLDLDGPPETALTCAVTGVTCVTTGRPRFQDNALLASQFASVSVPQLGGAAAQELTLAAWVAPSERPQGYQSILYRGKRQGTSLQQIHFYLSLFDGRPEFKFKDEQGVWHGIMRNADVFSVPGAAPVPLADVPAVPTARWSHVAASFDHGRVVLYLDGEPILAGTTSTDHLVPNGHPLRIGEAQADGGARTYLFRGLIDAVRIHGRALSPEEIATLYARERATHPAEPLTIERPLPEGYDPEFRTKLPLVAAWELDPPPVRVGPQTTCRVMPHRGALVPVIDGVPVYPMAMMPEPYAADEMIELSCRDFAAAGIDLYSEILWSWATPGQGCHGWWRGPTEYDFDRLDRRIRAIIAANPNARIFPRVKLNPPQWWLAEHPDEIARNADGSPGEQASLASLAWEETYARLLRDLIGHMEGSDYAGHIIGYHPAGGRASEWYWWGENGQTDFSPAAVARWRSWLAQRYGDHTEALRAAWGDPAASFATAMPPDPDQRQAVHHGIFRDPIRARRVIDYRCFLSDMVSRNIVRSCRIVKEATGGSKLAGVFYGYSAYSVTQDGFQGLRAVLDAPEVDFLASPTAYDYRRGGEPGSFVSTYFGSYRLHGKLFFDEVDTRTHLYPGDETYRTDTLAETQAVIQRAAGYSLSRGTGLWWFLLAGNATFHQAEVMDTVAAMSQAGADALDADRAPTAQVAVFVDEPSMHYTGGEYQVRRAYTRQTIDELACMGAPFDVYLLSDIGHPDLPDYRLYIFLNAFALDDDLRRSIETVVRREDRTALWVYAPGYVKATGFDVAGIADLTGIAIRASEESMPCECTVGPPHTITDAMPALHTEPWQVAPGFSATDPQATVLATTAGQPSLVVREFADWRSAWSLLPPRRELLLGLCRYAGVHVYSESFDPFFANTGYAVIHTASAGAKRITLPVPADVTELTTGVSMGKRVRTIEDRLPAGVTRIYRTAPPAG